MAQKRRQRRRTNYPRTSPQANRIIRTTTDFMAGAGVLMLGAGTLGLIGGAFHK